MDACCAPGREGGEGHEHSGPQPISLGLGAGSAGVSAGAHEWCEIPGGTFAMGTEDPQGYGADGEGPIHQVTLPSFQISATTVTNAQFARFVEATGHQTTAEQFGSSFVFAGLLPDDFPPTPAVAEVPWWRDVQGAFWNSPFGPGSSIDDMGDHPVVHVSWFDAQAYAQWAGVSLPTEAQWERAARGGREGHHFPWGDEREPGGQHRMNVFQGQFPGNDTGDDGFIGTCPVKSFPANDFGLYEPTGNVWEWCADWFSPNYYRESLKLDPRGPAAGQARVTRGGSFLCHDSYCWRYRTDSRSQNTPDSSASNVGFRVVAMS
ncbi:formylglycine-generating enzyme family protein [Demequina flava]|uniref:formylglycine-generating enzyme family protein n=1 Tax=Demequina flava TaxID=1095025 RepID=UPI0007802325|nr:formylglycine-generating enzyme family protein [Demequina flava]